MANKQSTDKIISREEAKSLGLRHYFTGGPCKNGHIAPRSVCNKTCIECAKSHNKKQKVIHAEDIRERDRQRYWSSADKYRAKTRAWRAHNRQRALENCRKWREANRDKRIEYMKQWRLENPLASHVSNSKRRARLLEAGGSYTEQDVIEILHLQKRRCAYCKTKLDGKFHVDHVIPISKGGSNGRNNLQICCPTCNLRKHAKDPTEFAQELGFLI